MPCKLTDFICGTGLNLSFKDILETPGQSDGWDPLRGHSNITQMPGRCVPLSFIGGVLTVQSYIAIPNSF